MAFSFKTGSFSTRVFEARTATRSELFTLLTCLHTITFTLLSIISPLETISKKMWAREMFSSGCRPRLKNARQPEVNISHVKTVVSPRAFKLINCNSEKILKNRNVVVSKEAKKKTAHFWLPSTPQKRLVLTLLIRELPSLSTHVFETLARTGREYFACQGSGVLQIFILIISNGEKM